MQVSKDMIEAWKEEPVTLELFKLLTEYRNDIHTEIFESTIATDGQKARHNYCLGNLETINDILSGHIFKVEETEVIDDEDDSYRSPHFNQA